MKKSNRKSSIQEIGSHPTSYEDYNFVPWK